MRALERREAKKIKRARNLDERGERAGGRQVGGEEGKREKRVQGREDGRSAFTVEDRSRGGSMRSPQHTYSTLSTA